MERKYSENHLWVEIEESGDGLVARIGLTEYFTRIYGEVEEIELPEIGDTFEREEPMGEVTTGKRGSVDIIAPISGEVVDVNSDIVETPDMVNTDPEDEENWLVELNITDPAEVKELLEEDDYENYVSEILEEEEEEEEELIEEKEFLEEDIEEEEEE